MLPLDLTKLRKLAPDLPDWALVKAVGRMKWTKEREVFLTALSASENQSEGVRLAAASALTRLKPHEKVDVRRQLVADHPSALDLIDLERHLFLDEDFDPLVVPHLERASRRLSEYSERWHTWGDAPWRHETAVLWWRGTVEQEIGEEGLCGLLHRARAAQQEPLVVAAPAEIRPPNIILIMADDLGYETLGVNGGTSYRTPNLNALAKGGMRFTHAYATPLCTPSRVQLMTGKYSFRNYIGFGLLDPAEKTFGHLLKAAGYHTAVVGKWQLYGTAGQEKLAGRIGSRPEQAGFDEHLVWQVEKAGPRFRDPHLVANGAPARAFPGAYGPDLFAGFIEEFLERNRDRPFFLYYPMVLTHDPFRPTPGHPEYDTIGKVNDPEYFADNVAQMDRIVGRIIGKLTQLGLRENTLVLFVGDNGTDRDVTSETTANKVSGHKGFPTTAGTHVPLIASRPGTIAPGQVNENLIDLTDFLPTLMEVAGAQLPDGFKTDGLSFHPQLLGQAKTTRDWVFCHYAPQWGKFKDCRYVQDREWKYYEDGALYHLRSDPLEQNPIAEDDLTPEARKARQRFSEVLNRMR